MAGGNQCDRRVANRMKGVDNLPEPSWDAFYGITGAMTKGWRLLPPTRDIGLVMRDYDLEWDE